MEFDGETDETNDLPEDLLREMFWNIHFCEERKQGGKKDILDCSLEQFQSLYKNKKKSMFTGHRLGKQFRTSTFTPLEFVSRFLPLLYLEQKPQILRQEIMHSLHMWFCRGEIDFCSQLVTLLKVNGYYIDSSFIEEYKESYFLPKKELDILQGNNDVKKKMRTFKGRLLALTCEEVTSEVQDEIKALVKDV